MTPSPDRVRRAFWETGMVRIPGALTRGEATAIDERVWRHVERHSPARRDLPCTWRPAPHISYKALHGDPALAPLTRGPVMRAALDAVFASAGWLSPKISAHILLTFPTGDPWVMPAGWHMDCGFDQPTWPTPAVQIFAFFGPVEPQGGGTMLLAGSHRLVERYARALPEQTSGHKESWTAFMKHDPWLNQLRRGATLPDGGRGLVGARTELDGLPVEVVELTGEPGDVVITHLHTFHTASPNASSHPRQMLTKVVHVQSAAGT